MTVTTEVTMIMLFVKWLAGRRLNDPPLR